MKAIVDPHSAHTKILIPLVYLIVVLLIAMLVGCTSTQSVTVPAQESTLNPSPPAGSTYVQALPPMPPLGKRTYADSVTVYLRSYDTPPLKVRRMEVDRRTEDEHIGFVLERGGRSIEKTWPLPVYGMRWVGRPGQGSAKDGSPIRSVPPGREAPDSTVMDTQRVAVPARQPFPPMIAGLSGAPAPRQVDARVPDDDGFFDGVWDAFAWVGVLGLGGTALWLLRGFVPKVGL